MIKRSRTNKFNTLPGTSKKGDFGFFVLNKKQSNNMAKSKNNYLHQLDTDEIVRETVRRSDFGFSKKQYAETLLKKVNLKCKNQKQKEFSRLIEENEITICIGDSGVGKSYLSIAKALEMYKSGNYEKIYIITPIVESEESIGMLKGSLEDKTTPYLFSMYYIFDKIIGEDTRKKLVEDKVIEPIFMSYLRGVTISDSILIGDECQNLTIKGLKTLLTRIGTNSKFILSGDINQIDRFKKAEESGLKYIYEKLQGINGIGFVEFGKEDIVRNPIIGDILNRF
jgi:phosphate starvation-inducible PhoH-like protein